MKTYLHITSKTIATSLATPAIDGLRLLEPLKSIALESGMPMKILEEVNTGGDAEVHHHEADLWLCLQGMPKFTLGGKLVNERRRQNQDGSLMPNEYMGDRIEEGDEITLQAGEWLWIPPGIPHQHRSLGATRLVIVKIPKTPTA